MSQSISPRIASIYFMKKPTLAIWLTCLFLGAPGYGRAQSLANTGTVQGAVADPTGASVPGATVRIENPVSGFTSQAQTGMDGSFRLPNVPFATYRLTVTMDGFSPVTENVDVHSMVSVVLNVELKLATSTEKVTVESQGVELIQTEPSAGTDIDRNLFDKLPLESASSSVSSLITLSSPGVVADSNGLFHALGEHAENAFSVDGQPITDQQSKVFSNQIPMDAIQSLDVVSGIPPAEFGDKTSLTIRVVTRSGLGQKTPTGNVTTSYGSFGNVTTGFNLAIGGDKIGNFIAANGLRSGRFLDPPEFTPIHDIGNSENIFDRLDYQLTATDTLHLNVNYSRSWFQTPNNLDQLNQGIVSQGQLLGSQDQRSLINTINISGSWTHLISTDSLFSLNAFVRQDRYEYVPSSNILADRPATVSQTRHLTSLGAHADYSYAKGVHNIKVGVQLEHWFLLEQDKFGVTSATYNSPCLDANGDPLTGFNDPSQCAAAGDQPNIASNPIANPQGVAPCPSCFLPGLLQYDLTRGGSLLNFSGHTDIKEVALYGQDNITFGQFTFSLGLRADFYNGLSARNMAEPRIGVSYHLKKTNTLFRLGYARALVTPYNENLILSSSTGSGGLATNGVGAKQSPLVPGARNQFNAGFEQAFGKRFVIDGEYFWKYTTPDYDFDVLFSTPLTFPIQWTKSKIDGASVRLSMPAYHGLTLYDVLGHSRSRFFGPEIGGLIFNSTTVNGAFRIDHDEALESTFHAQYQYRPMMPWIAFNWRYDSGLVSGAVPCAGVNTGVLGTTCPGAITLGGVSYVNLSHLTADQQMQAGLFCGAQHPTLSSPLGLCPAALYGSSLVSIPAPGTFNPDTNPQRVTPRNVLDATIGHDNLFHGERYKWSLRLTVINLTNKVALYNFLSTFSGTHFISPRAETIEMGFHF
jgi:hypothetical protein